MIRKEIKCDGFHFMEQEILNKLLNLPPFSSELIYTFQGEEIVLENMTQSQSCANTGVQDGVSHWHRDGTGNTRCTLHVDGGSQ